VPLVCLPQSSHRCTLPTTVVGLVATITHRVLPETINPINSMQMSPTMRIHSFGSGLAVDTDRSGSIDVAELQAALVNGNWSRFDLDTVKMLMNIFDTDRNGTIGFQEFAGLWKYISEWQGVFRHFDRDRSGTIDRNELSEAFRNFGYRLPPSLLNLIEQKYASGPSTGYGPSTGITFDRFVRACVAVKTLNEAFQRADTDRDGWITISYEDFMRIVLSAP